MSQSKLLQLIDAIEDDNMLSNTEVSIAGVSVNDLLLAIDLIKNQS